MRIQRVDAPSAGASDGHPVAGRIDAHPKPLDDAIESWLDHMRARGRKPKSIKVFGGTIRAALKELGWCSFEQLGHEAIVGYLDAKVTSGQWRGATYNRNLTVFRSFTAWCVRNEILERDPMENAERAEDDSAPDSRAASTDEARRLIAMAWSRQQSDRRSTCNRALYWACLFLGGLRGDEPARWRREHLFLEESTPLIRWSKDINKNRKLQEVPIAPELAELLRTHMRERDAEILAAGRQLGAKDPVFARAPSRCTWRVDRARAGIADVDRRGLRFTPRSARKWFRTTLIQAGVPDMVVKFLQRHSFEVADRYTDLDQASVASALARLPRLWPHDDNPGGKPVDKPGGSGPGTGSDLNPCARDGNITPANPGSSQTVSRAPVPPRPAGFATRAALRDGGSGNGRVPQESEHRRADGSSQRPYQAENRHSRTDIQDESNRRPVPGGQIAGCSLGRAFRRRAGTTKNSNGKPHAPDSRLPPDPFLPAVNPAHAPTWFLGLIGLSYEQWDALLNSAPVPRGSNRLTKYAAFFNAVEINTTFYRIPASDVVRSWAKAMPPGFRCSVKMPREITHGPMSPGTTIAPSCSPVGHLLDAQTLDTAKFFFESLRPLGDKLGSVLIQFPPRFSAERGDELLAFLDRFARRAPLAVELRHDSWWSPQTEHAFRERGISCVATDESPGNEAENAPSETHRRPPRPIMPTADFLYVRWIGRHEQFMDLTKEHFDPTPRLLWWADRLRDLIIRHPNIRTIYGFFDNDFAGHAPATARRFMDLVGLSTPIQPRPDEPTLFE